MKEIYPKLSPEQAIPKVIEIAKWIESLPISNLPYVEMGFDTLNEDLIQKISQKRTEIKENYQSIQLKCRDNEFLYPSMLYQEHFPFWSQPFQSKDVEDFRVGDRVMNINSSLREYVPFALRGTVVGKTNDKVIVLFDEQFLNGNNIYGHCEEYKGAFVHPNYLVNLTKKFQSILKKNEQLVC